jgi:anti-sigma B factor antagonist
MSADSLPWPSGMEPFHCEVSPDGDTVRVRPIGELDLATAPILEAQLTELREAGYRQIVLDLRGLLFVDSTGLHVILRHDAEARRDGFSLALVPGSPEVQRIFEVAGVSSRLPFIDA